MHKNPVFIAIGAILLLALALAASLLPRQEAGTAPQSSTPASPVRVLRFGHNTPEDSALHQAALRFAQEVGEKSGGRLKIEVYPAQQLGTDDQMLELTRQGQLDILLTPTAKISVSVPAMQYADLPFYFPAREDLYAMLDGEPGQILLDKLRAIDLVGVTFWENGFKHFTGKKPLRSPADFNGMNVRIMKSRMLMEQFHAFGAHSIPIDFYATRQALADGVVDAQENPLIAIVSMGLHEVQPHLTLSNHGYLGYVFMLSAKVFETLPQEQQHLLMDTARGLTAWERDETHRREQALLETIRKAGVTIHELSEPERRQFAAATAHIPALFEDVIGADLISRTEELLDQKYGTRGAQIVIGMDADLSMDSRQAGLAIKRGAQLAIDEINAAGGVLGKPLKLIARDHKGLPTLGISNIEAFVARPDVVAVLGGQQATVPIAEQEAVHRSGIPHLAPWSAAAQVVDNGYKPNFVFRVSANDERTGPYIIDYLRTRFRRPAILLENTIWGRANLDSMGRHLRQFGLDFVQVETFNRGETDFQGPLARIEQKGADVIVMIANPFEGQHIVRALAARPGHLPLVSHWGISGGDFWSGSREAIAKLDLVFFQTFSFLGNPRPAARRLAERYQQAYGVDSPRNIPAPQGVAQAHDLVLLLAQAIRQAGSTDRHAVRDALERLSPVEGAVRTYAPAFNPIRHDALDESDYHMARYAEDGAIVPLER